MEHSPDVFQKLQKLLSEYGWETGLRRLESEIQAAPDAARRALLEQFSGWMAAERGYYEEAVQQLQQLEHVSVVAGWAVYGQAFVALYRKAFPTVHALLDRASRLADSADASLLARIAVLRGTVFLKEGKPDLAFPFFHTALELAGSNTFTTGRVLDALGTAYAGKDNFHAAREFYERALIVKKQFQDEAGLALSYGQLGRLYLDWDYLDKAAEQFEEDLKVSRKIGARGGEAQMYNHLGQVALARGEWQTAADWLEESIRRSQQGRLDATEGYAHKDRALAYLAEGKTVEAEQEVRQAETLFKKSDFVEGLAHVNRVWGMVWRAQGKYDEAERALGAALGHFEARGEHAEVARIQWEVARTLRARGSPRPLVIQALLTALDAAEACRRAVLVRGIGAELKAVDEAAYWCRTFRRVRGRDLPGDTDWLTDGDRDSVTVMFFDLKGSTDYGRTNDPEVVIMTLNQMMADLAPELRRERVAVTSYLGDGFIAILRGVDHAIRAVRAALGLLRALREFNRPRHVLGLLPFTARVGMATGEVFLGNVGTYQKMDYTAIGNTVNLAARLQAEAEPDMPCISRATHDLVRERFLFKSDEPRTVTPKGIGPCDVWDVVEQKG